MVFYFTATGNSLYAAKLLDEERYSIPQELKKKNRHYKADKIGIVCPLYEFEVPKLVRDFIQGSDFETDYFYLVVTFGCHQGGVAERMNDYLKSIGKPADYINTVIMLDNALLVFDMAEQRKIDPEKKVDEHLAIIRADINEGKKMIQTATEEETAFYGFYQKMIAENGPLFHFPLYRVTDECIGCGTCARVCPRGCIRIIDKKPDYDYTDCANCMACIQACPKKAIKFAGGTEVNPEERYRNPHITLAEIIAANRQQPENDSN